MEQGGLPWGPRMTSQTLRLHTPSSSLQVKQESIQSTESGNKRRNYLIETAYHGLMTATDDDYRRLWCDELIDAIEGRA